MRAVVIGCVLVLGGCFNPDIHIRIEPQPLPDVDAGPDDDNGSLEPVALKQVCETCVGNGDCQNGLCDNGVCRQRDVVDVDWVTECVTDGVSSFLQVAALQAGSYRITAIASAGAFDDDQTDWYYQPECPGLVFDDSNPATRWHETAVTPAAAFALVTPLQITRTWPGGDLRCRHRDSACTDNHGENSFQLDLLCPGE